MRVITAVIALLVSSSQSADCQRVSESRTAAASPVTWSLHEPKMAATQRPQRIGQRRDPWVATALAVTFPGAGHEYAGEPGRALAILGLVLIGVAGATGDNGDALVVGGGVLAVGTYLASIVDAPRAAHRFNRRGIPHLPSR